MLEDSEHVVATAARPVVPGHSGWVDRLGPGMVGRVQDLAVEDDGQDVVLSGGFAGDGPAAVIPFSDDAGMTGQPYVPCSDSPISTASNTD